MLNIEIGICRVHLAMKTNRVKINATCVDRALTAPAAPEASCLTVLYAVLPREALSGEETRNCPVFSRGDAASDAELITWAAQSGLYLKRR